MSWHPPIRWLLVPICLLVVLAGRSRADLSISIASGTVTPGGTLTLDIGLESTTPPQGLADFELILQITPLTPDAVSTLQFVNPQSEVFLEDADYVFAGNSDAVNEGLTTVGGQTADQITFFDFTANGLNVPVTSGQLLATVDIAHGFGGASAADAVGEQFQISVSPLSLFGDAGFNDLDFSSTSGVVTVGPVAIPEPGSAAVLTALAIGCFVRRGRRDAIVSDGMT